MNFSNVRLAALLIATATSASAASVRHAHGQAPKRSGFFKVSGVLVYNSGQPLRETRVVVAPLVPGDAPGVFASRVNVRVENGRLRTGAGYGTTDQEGRFELRVRREEFEGPTILFAVLLETRPAAKMQEVLNKATSKPMGFEIAESAPARDLGRIIVE